MREPSSARQVGQDRRREAALQQLRVAGASIFWARHGVVGAERAPDGVSQGDARELPVQLGHADLLHQRMGLAAEGGEPHLARRYKSRRERDAG